MAAAPIGRYAMPRRASGMRPMMTTNIAGTIAKSFATSLAIEKTIEGPTIPSRSLSFSGRARRRS